MKSAQDETHARLAANVVPIRQATSARQTSEWGMRSSQGIFQTLKDEFGYDENGLRKIMLLCSVHLFNMRARMVGINQILSVYMPQLKFEAITSCRAICISNLLLVMTLRSPSSSSPQGFHEASFHQVLLATFFTLFSTTIHVFLSSFLIIQK